MMRPSGESTTWLYRVSGVLHVGLIGVSVPPAALSETNGQETQARPNLLFIVTDDQGPWTRGAEGRRNAVTPDPPAQTARRELKARLHEAMRRMGDPQKETR